MILLTFFTAIALSAVAAYYSVIGLAAIFPGSFWPVVLMGGVLEASKLVTVSWLYRNWSRAPRMMKYYMSIAVTILMLITSMGIFGYLSKAHMEHSTESSPLVDKVALFDEKIKVYKDNIDAARKELKQYDELVDQMVGRTTDEKGMDKAQAIRRTQQKDRSRLLSEIQQNQASIAALQEQRAPISNELKKVEADVGPIKYIAELFYNQQADASIVDKAVRLVILLIIVVFDPLAILLLIAANISTQVKENGWIDEPPVVANAPVPTNNDAILQAIQELNEKVDALKSPPVDEYAYLKQPFKHFENLEPVVAKPVEEVVEEPVEIVELPKEEVDDKIQIEKDNVFILDEVTGETMPAIPSRKLEPKYDYDASFAFVEKANNKIDGGSF